MQSTQDVIMGLGMILGLVTITFIIAKYTYQVKKAMIDRGLTSKTPNEKLRYLDIGGILLGLGIGLIVSSIFTTMDLSEDTMDLLVWGTILIFGSFGLALAHFIRRKLES
ncbi:hypothetical protein [Ulvibacterium marinum]|uniref:Uncharacterized protein n=1 Tax=Ulvibacterium marinum TaxID=2419782 RepID=A0A3B0C9A7_9FLAO|nr:hypothetical protein [Ulvibacterium marinum]RKN81054.1 hypothetical protein D7Z94_08885 [Ulvibacterium marinum]